MAHGIGLSSAHNYYVNVDYPLEIDGLLLWLKYNTGYIGTGGRTSSAHNLTDDINIIKWSDRSGNNNHAVQSTATDCPIYQLSDGSLAFLDNSKWLNLTSTITISSGIDFTLIMRVKFATTDSNTMFGHDSNNLFNIQTSKSFRVKLGGDDDSDFAEATATVGTSDYYTVILTREDNILQVYINGGSYSDKNWDTAEDPTDSDVFTITNIGASADDATELNGYVKDVLIYNEIALDSTQRSLMYSYLDGQLGVS